MEKTKLNLIYRYSFPGKYDHAEKGTLCNVMIGKKKFQIYCQVAEVEDKPQWAFIGEFNKDTPIALLENEVKKILKDQFEIDYIIGLLRK